MRRLRIPFILIACTLLVACPHDKSDDTTEDDKYVYELIVTPDGSFLADRYWRSLDGGEHWGTTTKDFLPQGAAPTLWRRTVTGLGHSGIVAPQVADEITTVALFSGGRGPGNALASNRAAYYDETGTMVTGLTMTAARIEHATAAISGERALIAGGFGPDIPTVVLNSAEIFTGATRTFAPTGSMLARRGYHTMTTLGDGRVLVAGGSVPTQGTGPSTAPSATSEFFSAGTFTAGPAMNVARSGHRAVLLNDGRVLLVGGTTSRAAEVYSPSTSTFVPVGDMLTARTQGHVAIKLPNGKVLVAGGDIGNINATAAAEVFDPATNAFTAVGNMTVPRLSHFVAPLADGRVLIGGGRTTGGSALASTEIFNPSSNSFSAGASLPRDAYNSAAVAVTGYRPGQ